MRHRGWSIGLAVAIAVVPVVAHAQRGAGGRGRGASGMNEDGPPPDNGIRAKDVEKLNPATLILAKAKDLKLEDAERTQLTDIAKRYDWNTNMFARVADSLRTVVDARRTGSRGSRGGAQASGDGNGTADRPPTAEEIMAARKMLSNTLTNIRAEYDTAAARALNALAEPQRAKARSMLDKPARDLSEMLHKAGGT